MFLDKTDTSFGKKNDVLNSRVPKISVMQQDVENLKKRHKKLSEEARMTWSRVLR